MTNNTYGEIYNTNDQTFGGVYNNTYDQQQYGGIYN